MVVVTDPGGIAPNARFAAELIGANAGVVSFEFFTASGEVKRFTYDDYVAHGGDEGLVNAIRAEAPQK